MRSMTYFIRHRVAIAYIIVAIATTALLMINS